MFKYAPGMESGLGAALNMMRKHAEPDGDEGTTVTNIFNMEDKGVWYERHRWPYGTHAEQQGYGPSRHSRALLAEGLRP